MTGGSPAWWSYKIELNNLKPTFFVSNTDGTTVSAQADSAIELNKWYYLTGVYNGSQVQIYIDSKPADSTPPSLSGNVMDSDTFLQIGGLDTPVTYFFHGLMDELKIYPYARTSSQILQDYNAGKSHTSSSKGSAINLGSNTKNADALSNGLVGYWKADESSSPLLDSSGNGNTAPTSGSLNFAPGKFGNSFRSGVGTTNLLLNPGFEAGTSTYWSNSGTGTSIVSSPVSSGRYSLKVFGDGVSQYQRTYSTITPISIGLTTYVSFDVNGQWVNVQVQADQSTNFVGGATCNWTPYDPSGGGNTSGNWVRFVASCYAYPATTDGIRFRIEATDATPNNAVFYLDNAQIEQSVTATNFVDGSLGVGYTWTDTAHNSSSVNYTSTATVADSTSLQFSNSMSVSTWFKVNTFYPDQRLIDKTNNGTGYALAVNNNIARFITGNGSTYDNLDAGTTLALNTWYHLTGTVDNGIKKIYLNGNLQNTASITFNGSGTGTTLKFGTRSAPTQSFAGLLDEIRLYSRALSSSEISQLYNYAPGPVGYWDFDEGVGTSVNDSSGNNNTGTWNGTGSHWTTGKFNDAGNFNVGTSDYVTIPNSASLNVPNGWTISSWIYLNTVPTGYAAIFTDSYPGAESKVQAVVNFNANAYPESGVYSATIGWKNAVAASPVPLKQWTYVTGTYDGSSTTLKMYINGILSATTIGVSQVGDVTTAKRIGRRWDTADYLNGKIDDVKLYNYARTPKQIVERYECRPPRWRLPYWLSNWLLEIQRGLWLNLFRF